MKNQKLLKGIVLICLVFINALNIYSQTQSPPQSDSIIEQKSKKLDIVSCLKTDIFLPFFAKSLYLQGETYLSRSIGITYGVGWLDLFSKERNIGFISGVGVKYRLPFKQKKPNTLNGFFINAEIMLFKSGWRELAVLEMECEGGPEFIQIRRKETDMCIVPSISYQKFLTNKWAIEVKYTLFGYRFLNHSRTLSNDNDCSSIFPKKETRFFENFENCGNPFFYGLQLDDAISDHLFNTINISITYKIFNKK